MDRVERKTIGQKITPLLGYLVVALLVTYPLIARLNDGILGDGADGPLFLWNLWWVKTALLHGTNPFWTDMIWFPHTLSLHFHTLTFTTGLVSIPFQLAGLSLPATLNWLFLGGLAATAWATHRLLLEWIPHRLIAWFGGLILGFSPYVFTQAFGGHFNLTTLWPIPLVLLFLTRFARQPSRRWAILAGVSFAALALNDWQYAAFLVPFLVLWLIWTPASRRLSARSLLELTLWGGGTAFFLTGWVLIPAVNLLDTPANPAYQPDLARHYEVEPIEFILPSWLHPVFGPWAWRTYWQFRHAWSEQGVYLGWLPIALTSVTILFAILRKSAARPLRRLVFFWMAIALVFAVLALGPYLAVNYQETNIVLPYRFLQSIPLLGWSRVASRMIVLTNLALAVLASLGLWLLIKRLRPRWQIVWVGLASLILLFEFQMRLPFQTIRVPNFYQTIRKDTTSGTVLDLPFNLQLVTIQQYYQSVHGRPIITALHSRTPPPVEQFYKTLPGLRVLVGEPIGPADRDPADIAASLDRLNLRYVVIDRTRWAPWNPWTDSAYAEERTGYLRDVLGAQYLAAEDGFELWCLPRASPCPEREA